MPLAGRRFVLRITARKFVCENPACDRRIFCERLGGLAAAHARTTARLAGLHRVIGFPVVVPAVSQSQGNASPAPKPADAPKDIPDRVFNTPEEVLKAYLAAERWEERLPCVLDPKAVRQLMAERYKNVNLGAVGTGFLPGTPRVKTGTGGHIIVDVDVRESHPYHQYLRYAVVKSGAGYKVDWLESIRLGEEDNLRAEVMANTADSILR